MAVTPTDAEKPFIDATTVEPDRKLLERAPEALLRRKRVLPVRREADGSVLVAMADPSDGQAIDALERALAAKVVPATAEPRALEVAIERALARHPKTTRTIRPQGPGAAASLIPGAGAVEVLDDLLREAVARRASDVHVEPQRDGVRVRFRVDGVLVAREAPLPAELAGPLVSRVKVLAGLDIAERREPQDGAFAWTPAPGARPVDLRVATAPTRDGERATIRLLGLETDALSLGSLGWDGERLAAIRGLLARPHGLMLLCGPTGSGKSTTLYAFLRELNRVDLNILTVEDPVEFSIPGVAQIQVDAVGKVTFASALRSLLRHDPDVLMIGEIRDAETADMAVKAAMTGHLVLSTLHTNTAAGAIARLAHLEVPPFLTASTLAAVVAQRLVRKLCACHATRPATAEEARLLGIEPGAPLRVPAPAGCGACQGTGYRGRTGIFELVVIDRELGELVARGEPEAAIRAELRRRGIATLRSDGLARVRDGLTTLDEVLAATVEES